MALVTVVSFVKVYLERWAPGLEEQLRWALHWTSSTSHSTLSPSVIFPGLLAAAPPGRANQSRPGLAGRSPARTSRGGASGPEGLTRLKIAAAVGIALYGVGMFASFLPWLVRIPLLLLGGVGLLAVLVLYTGGGLLWLYEQQRMFAEPGSGLGRGGGRASPLGERRHPLAELEAPAGTTAGRSGTGAAATARSRGCGDGLRASLALGLGLGAGSVCRGAVAGMFAWLAALAAARGGRALDSLLVVLALAGVAAWLERGILRQLKLELRWPAVWLAAEGLGLRREARRREQHPIWTSAIDSVCRLERVRDLKVKTPWAARAAKLLGIEPWTTVWVEELGANRHGRSYIRRHVVPYVVAGHELRDEFWALRLKDQP